MASNSNKEAQSAFGEMEKPDELLASEAVRFHLGLVEEAFQVFCHIPNWSLNKRILVAFNGSSLSHGVSPLF